MIRICTIRCPEEQLPGSTYSVAQMIFIGTAFSCKSVRQDINPEHSEVKQHSFEKSDNGQTFARCISPG